jgi:hypothetical protein
MRTRLTSLTTWQRTIPWNGAVPAWRNTTLQYYFMAVLAGAVIGLLCWVSPLLAIVAVFAIGAAIVSLQHPVVLPYVMIAAVTLTSGIVRGKLFPMLRPNELALVLAIGVAVVVLLASRYRRLITPGQIPTIMGFLVLVLGTTVIPVVSYTIRGHQITTDHILDLVAPFQYYLLFWLFVILPQNETDRRRLLVWMLICSALVAVVGLLQAAGIGAIKNLLATWYASSHNEASLESRVGRITSLMGAWNALGILMMATLIIGWAMLPNVAHQTTRYVVWACLGLCGICLLASGSFAGIGLTVAGIMMLELLEKRVWQSIKRLFPIVLAMGVFFVVLQPLLMPLVAARLEYQFGHGSWVPETLEYRFWIWTDVFWPHIVAHPIWGAYLDAPDYFAWKVPESQYISLLFRFGIVGMVAHLLWVAIVLRWLHRRFTASQGLSRAIAASAFSILVMMSIAGLTNAVFYFSGAADFMWILFGLVVNSEETN